MGLTSSAMAREIEWKERTFGDWVAAGRIPYVIEGKRKRFDPAEVKAAIAALLPKEGHKVCSKCGEEKPFDGFLETQGKKGACYGGWCNGCRIELRRATRRARAMDEGREFVSSTKEARGERKEAREAEKRSRDAKAKEEVMLRKAARDAQLKAEGREGMAHTLAESKSSVARQRERYSNDPNYKATIKAKKIRRKRAIAGTQVVPINHLEIAERDGWRCGICGKRVAEIDWSLDHIVPLSKGGEHTHENVTLAHRRCNSRKGNRRIPVQVPMFARGIGKLQ